MSALVILALAASLWGIHPALFFGRLSRNFCVLATWSLTGALILGAGLIAVSPSKFQHDSLWTLASFDQAVIVGMTAAMMLFGVWLVIRTARFLASESRNLAVRVLCLVGNLALTAVCYFAIWLLSPQIYFTYYRFVFANLPKQWVVRTPSDVSEFGNALILLNEDNIAGTATGLYFWSILSLTISVHAMTWRAAREQP